MGKRRIHRQKGPRLSVPRDLLQALESLHGKLDQRNVVDRIARGVERLHRGLTQDRDTFIKSRYMQESEVRFAYGTYFLCAQAPKLWPVLERVFRPNSEPRTIRVLEIGCGPGTGLAAMVPWATGRNIKLDYTATDYASAALKDAQTLATALNQPIKTQQVDLNRPIHSQLPGQEPFDLVLAMNVLNELSPLAVEQLPNSLMGVLASSGHLVAIEPAAREPSRKTLTIRDQLLENGWTLTLPCTHQQPCPALIREDDWCHETWGFERPEFMKQVDHRVGTRRETLKATWFVLRPTSAGDEVRPAMGDHSRAVSELFVEKGRVRIRVCGKDGLATLELQRRDRSPNNEALMNASRYSLLSYAGGRVVGDAIRLDPDAQCTEIDESDESAN